MGRFKECKINPTKHVSSLLFIAVFTLSPVGLLEGNLKDEKMLSLLRNSGIDVSDYTRYTTSCLFPIVLPTENEINRVTDTASWYSRTSYTL